MSSFVHIALFYRDEREYCQHISGFIRTGLAAGAPAFIAVPAAGARLLRAALGADAARVRFADMTEMGMNPARIIPRIREFIDEHSPRRVRYVGEPIWPARGPAEIREATRHEALINVAFGSAPISIMCPYDLTRLEPAIVADARLTHPALQADGGGCVPSPVYPRSFRLPDSCDGPLPPPPARLEVCLRVGPGLSALRNQVRARAGSAGLSPERAEDLVMAVSEVAANVLVHGGADGTAEIWREPGEIICQIRSAGVITDPLAGRHAPDMRGTGGHGLWLANHVCDLTEIRSGASGTTVRLHMSLR